MQRQLDDGFVEVLQASRRDLVKLKALGEKVSNRLKGKLELNDQYWNPGGQTGLSTRGEQSLKQQAWLSLKNNQILKIPKWNNYIYSDEFFGSYQIPSGTPTASREEYIKISESHNTAFLGLENPFNRPLCKNNIYAMAYGIDNSFSALNFFDKYLREDFLPNDCSNRELYLLIILRFCLFVEKFTQEAIPEVEALVSDVREEEKTELTSVEEEKREVEEEKRESVSDKHFLESLILSLEKSDELLKTISDQRMIAYFRSNYVPGVSLETGQPLSSEQEDWLRLKPNEKDIEQFSELLFKNREKYSAYDTCLIYQHPALKKLATKFALLNPRGSYFHNIIEIIRCIDATVESFRSQWGEYKGKTNQLYSPQFYYQIGSQLFFFKVACKTIDSLKSVVSQELRSINIHANSSSSVSQTLNDTNDNNFNELDHNKPKPSRLKMNIAVGLIILSCLLFIVLFVPITGVSLVQKLSFSIPVNVILMSLLGCMFVSGLLLLLSTYKEKASCEGIYKISFSQLHSSLLGCELTCDMQGYSIASLKHSVMAQDGSQNDHTAIGQNLLS